MERLYSLDEGLAALRDKTMTELSFARDTISDEEAKYIADALKHNTTLTTLDLYDNQIGYEGAKHIADALEHNKTLTALDLKYNEIGVEGAKHVAEALKHNTSLTTLSLDANRIGDEEAKLIADALKQNKPLKTLEVRSNRIGDEGAKHIAEALKHNTTLTTLCLDNNKMGAEAAKHMAEALKHNTTLTTLNLDTNKIGDEGTKHIAEALKHNKTLTTLYLEDNRIGYEGVKHIADGLKQNTTLTTLDLNDNQIGEKGAKYVCDAINESIAARRRLFRWPKPPVNRKRKHSSSEDPAQLTKRLATECSVCEDPKDQLHLLPCLHYACEQCIHDIAAISPSICGKCQEPFSSTFLLNNVVGTQTAIHCPQHVANNATTFCSDCNVLVCIACEHDASHHLDELDEAIKRIQIDLPPILDDLLVQLEQVNEAIEYIVFARLSALNKLASIKSSIQLSFEALNNQELASDRDALLEQAQILRITKSRYWMCNMRT